MSEAQAPLRILAIGPAPSAPDSRGGMATVMSLMADHPDPQVAIRVVPTFADRAVVSRMILGLRGMAVAAGLILAGRADVLHVHLAHGGSVVRKSVPLLVARLRGTPTVVHEHSYDFAGWFDGLPRWGQAIVRRAVRADRWLVLGSRHVTDFAPRLQMDESRILVMHNPVVLPPAGATPKPPGASERIRAVSLGRLGRRKGSYDIVAAVVLLPRPVRDRLHIVLAGDGELDDMRQAIRDADVGDVIEVRGWQNPTECDALLSESQVFLLPSYEEGLPMALLEAMARGLAPVVTPVGGIPNVITDGVEGLLIQPGDVAALAEAISRLVENDEVRATVSATAAERSRDFDVATWYGDLTDLWTSLVR